MNIKTSYVYPPIPDRRFDWQAYDDDTFDGPGSPVGIGPTEQAAIDDLWEQLQDRGITRFSAVEIGADRDVSRQLMTDSMDALRRLVRS